MDYISDLHEPRTNAEQSETTADLRGSFVSEQERRFQQARSGKPPSQGRHLYFIKMAGSRPVKIGRGSRPEVRLQTLQVGSPYKLTLLGALEGCGQYEAEFHRHLARFRMVGEWFSWSRMVEATVKLALSGGDWRTEIAEKPREIVTGDEWWIGSPLYQGNPNYPQFQDPPKPYQEGASNG